MEGDYISGTYAGKGNKNALSLFKSNVVSGAAIKLDKFEIKIDGEVVYSGDNFVKDNEIEVTSLKEFGFNLEWSVDNEKISGDALKGQTVAIQIGKFKGLTFEGLEKFEGKPLRIGKVEVAKHSLLYPEKLDSEGYRTLLYVIEFNDEIVDFENVKGYFGGTSTFSSKECNIPLDYIFGTEGKGGTITVTEDWVYPQGQGWGCLLYTSPSPRD